METLDFILSQMVPIRGPKILQVLSEKLWQITRQEKGHILAMDCGCHLLPPTIPRYEGCCLFRGEENIKQVFDSQYHSLLLQNMKNATMASFSQIKTGLQHSFTALQRFTNLPLFQFAPIQKLLLQKLKFALENVQLPSSVNLLALKTFKNRHSGFSFQALDKNPGGLIIMCKKTCH